MSSIERKPRPRWARRAAILGCLSLGLVSTSNANAAEASDEHSRLNQLERSASDYSIALAAERREDHGRAVMAYRAALANDPDFVEAMRRVLRQDPDVILLGEMRDLDTISAAITAAETGHLVFGTLHTTGSARTVDRIIDAFPANQQGQIRAQLSVSIQAVISQVLMARQGGGRVAGFEIMRMNSAIANLIRKNETNKIQSTIQTSKRFGMVTLDDHLIDLLQDGAIDARTALAFAQDPRDVEARIS